MTRKHFVAIAWTFAEQRPRKDSEQFGMWAVLVAEMADTLAKFNPQFARHKFIDACMGEES